MPHTTELSIRAQELASPDHILVATDLTDGAHLVPHAIAQAQACGAGLTLVHAITAQPVDGRGGLYAEESQRDRDARHAMTDLKQQIEASGLACRTICRHGFATDVIREALEQTGATRLIVGTHGRSKLGQIILGSVTNDLLADIHVPVFAVGPSAGSAARQSKPRTILHPVSFDGDYIPTVGLAADLACAYSAELVLLHVLDLSARRGRTLRGAESELNSLVANYSQDDSIPGVKVRVTIGDPVKEILNSADETEADLIVMGIAGASPLFHFRDSAAYKVTAAAHCPVLALRHGPSQLSPASRKETNEDCN
ncbi:MAG TPA: universal stress protein [Acidobacteriaceae bacterium]|nr:universal stress protein [Acidobacteriaceae bacterium]